MKLFRLLRSTEAAELVEFAVVLPVMFTVFLGIFQFGEAYHIKAALETAAADGARAAALDNCVVCHNVPGGPIVPGNLPLTPNQIATDIVAPVLRANHIEPAFVTPGVCTGAVSSIAPVICVTQSSDPGQPDRVSFLYPYNIVLPLWSYRLQIRATGESFTE